MAKAKKKKEKPAVLDTTRSYGTTYGPGVVRYMQDYKAFDGQGNEIPEESEKISKPEGWGEAVEDDGAPQSDYWKLSKNTLRTEIKDRDEALPPATWLKRQLVDLLMELDEKGVVADDGEE